MNSLFHTKEGVEEEVKGHIVGEWTVLNKIGTVTVPHHWSDKSLILWRFSCKALTNVTDFGYHALPCFL